MRNTIVVIVGRKGSGKSSYAEKVGRRLIDAGVRLVVVEPHGSGYDYPGVPNISGEDPQEFARLRGRSCVVRAQSVPAGVNAFTFVWSVQELSTRPLWLLCDEAQLWLDPHRPDPVLLKIIQFGRHRSISQIYVTQRPAHCHKDMFSQADRRVIFNTTEPNDLLYLQKFAGADPERVRRLKMPRPPRRVGQLLDL